MPYKSKPLHPRQHLISEPAATALHDFKHMLRAWPAFLGEVTSSVAIEMLCLYWKEVRREKKSEVNPLELAHKVKTRRGRKARANIFENIRPSKIRADIEKTQRID